MSDQASDQNVFDESDPAMQDLRERLAEEAEKNGLPSKNPKRTLLVRTKAKKEFLEQERQLDKTDPLEPCEPTEEELAVLSKRLGLTPETLKSVVVMSTLDPTTNSPTGEKMRYRWRFTRRRISGDIHAELSPNLGLTAEEPTTQTANTYALFTGQETQIVYRGVSRGQSGEGWTVNPHGPTLVYADPTIPSHYLELIPTEQEIAEGFGIKAAEKLTKEQTADAIFALACISHTLAPPCELPPNADAAGWIDLSDVVEKALGGVPHRPEELEARRREAWNYIQFFARANVKGSRSIPYFDKNTGETLDTHIDGPVWLISQQQRPIQTSLFRSEEVPVRVRIVVSPEWTRLTTSPDLAQYLPACEAIGTIPADKPSGAWARVIGAVLLQEWREHPQEAIASRGRPIPGPAAIEDLKTETLKLTRRDLLTTYPPKLRPVSELFAKGYEKPGRAITFWYQALRILVQQGTLAPEGEPALYLHPPKPEGYGWQEGWLNEVVDLRPSLALSTALQTIAANTYLPKPRDLQEPKKKRTRKIEQTKG